MVSALGVEAGTLMHVAAALGVAALIDDPDRFAGLSVATILCGSNVAPADFHTWVMQSAQGD